MRRVLLALVLAGSALPALAQTEPQIQKLGQPQGPSHGAVAVAPRDPSGASAGTTTGNQPRMNQTVQEVGSKLLDQEKDRPRLPGQIPSPSQTLPGGTARQAASASAGIPGGH